MKTIRMSSRLAALLIAALIIPFNIPNRGGVLAQDLEPQAAPGDLDATFGNGGEVTTSFPDFPGASGSAMAIQPDGKIVVVGEAESSSGTRVFAIARYNTDGSLDSTFGKKGQVTTDFFGFGDYASAVAIQPDGRIVVGGTCTTTADDTDFALARYNSDGSLDGAFGAGGKLNLDLGGHVEDHINSVLLRSDGRIVVVGPTLLNRSSGLNTALARFNQNGSLDATFGSGGKVISTLVNPHKAALTDGNELIVVAGATNLTSSAPSGDFGMARFLPSGSLDTSFGNSGLVSTDFFGQRDDALGVSLQNDNRIIVTGIVSDGSGHNEFGVARYTSAGVLDPTFGSGGKLTTNFGGTDERAVSAAQYTGGRIFVGGWTGQPASSVGREFALACYQSDGTLDPSFGAAGKVVTEFRPGSIDALSTIAVTPGARSLIAVGVSNSSFAIARYVAFAPPAEFSLGFDPSSATGERGTTVRIRVLINRTNGFTGNVTITPPDTSGIGVKVKPGDAVSTNDDSINIKFKIKGQASQGPQQLVFKGQDDSGGATSATLTLVIQ